MRQAQHCLVVRTRGRGFYEITGSLTQFLEQSGLAEGFAVIHIRHTSASLVIQENADPEVRRDLERFIARICPDGDPIFQHDCEGPDDMPAHIRTLLTAVNLSIPFTRGKLVLGTWQGVFVWEHRQAPHPREVFVHLCGE